MALLPTKTRNLICKAVPENSSLEFHLSTIKVNGMKRGCSGFVVNSKTGRTVYVNTEYCKAQNLGYLYRFCDKVGDYAGLKYRNRFARTPEELAKGIAKCLTVENVW